MTDLQTLRTRLTEAENARHELLTGARVQKVTRDGRSLEFTSARESLDSLNAYIAELQAQIAEQTGETFSGVTQRRAYGPRFL